MMERMGRNWNGLPRVAVESLQGCKSYVVVGTV